MGILNKELIDKNSPAWIGFQYALFSLVSTFFFSFIISLLFLLIFPDVFGFFFTTFSQEMRLVVVGTFFGTLISARRFRISKRMTNSEGFLGASLVWFTVFQILILSPLFWDAIFAARERHYGLTAADQLKEAIPLTFITIVVFFLVNRFFKKKNK